MRDFFKDAWKIATGFAAGAFVLSLLIGLMAGNPFGVALSRAFLLALLFAALGVVVRAVAKAYLPELTAGASPAGDDSLSRAGAVDIVVSDDEALRRQAYRREPPGAAGGSEAEPQAAGGRPGAAEETDGLPPGTGPEPGVAGEPGTAERLSEELAEEIPAADGDAPAASGGQPEAVPRDGEEIREAEAAMSAPPADDLLTPAPTEDLDALPDIADLELPAPPAARRPPARMPRRIPQPRVGETPEEAMRNLLGGQDPATLARAIRTSLKKDEKG